MKNWVVWLVVLLMGAGFIVGMLWLFSLARHLI
jgi:hypothetical protein